MILSFRDKRTRAFAVGNRIKAFEGIEHKAEMKLDQLESVMSLLDLDLPGNHLETLRGTARASTVSVSMTSGGYVLSGLREQRGRSMLRSWTIIKEI